MEKVQNKNIKLCEICGEEATSLCFKCISYFCEGCYKFVHDKKINIQHKKEKIDYYSPFETKCQDHVKIPITLFCVEEKGKTFYIISFII